ATTAFNNNGGGAYTGNRVPVENDFGPGSRCVHWRESVTPTELMTPIIEAPAIAMPLSEMTVKSLADLGYMVATSGWDTCLYPTCAPPAGVVALDAAVGRLELVNDVWLGPIYSRDEQGQIIVVVPDRRR
ncbi:MAG: hypothetical protein OER89_06645, partial [Gemmatimonadota bacterium]|nr:hypothetical protein [Gemmatimonadota bacterium]